MKKCVRNFTYKYSMFNSTAISSLLYLNSLIYVQQTRKTYFICIPRCCMIPTDYMKIQVIPSSAPLHILSQRYKRRGGGGEGHFVLHCGTLFPAAAIHKKGAGIFSSNSLCRLYICPNISCLSSHASIVYYNEGFWGLGMS
jgi:hypothetical protein